MFILKSTFDPIQSEFQKSQPRGKLFIAVLLAILLRAVGSRSSQLCSLLSQFWFQDHLPQFLYNDGSYKVAMDAFMAVCMEADSITANAAGF